MGTYICHQPYSWLGIPNVENSQAANILSVRTSAEWSHLTVKILRPVRSNAIQYTADRCPRIRLCRRMCSYVLTGLMELKRCTPVSSLPRCTFTVNKTHQSREIEIVRFEKVLTLWASFNMCWYVELLDEWEPPHNWWPTTLRCALIA